MPVDELIADPIDDLEPVTDPVDADEPAEPGDGAELKDGTEGEEPEGEREPITSLFDPSTGALNGQIKAFLTQVGQKQPDLAKFVKKTLYRAGEFDKVFPAGVTEAKEVIEKIEEFGGVDGITEKLEGAEELYTLADAFEKADPAFVEDMIASSPESFAALAPVVIQRFAQTNPEDFSAYFGRLVHNDISKAGIPLMMMRLDDVLGDNAKAREIVGNLNQYFGLWKQLADKPLGARPAARQNTDTQRPNTATKSVSSQEWAGERDQIAKMIRANAYKAAISGKTPSSEEKAQIAELYQVRCAKAADTQFPGWKQKLEGYAKKGDKNGYMRYARRVLETVGPQAMSSAIKSTIKGGQPQNRQQGQPGQKAQPVQAAQGFTPVGKEPAAHEIDWGTTPKSMIVKNQAVLTNGKKVQWR